MKNRTGLCCMLLLLLIAGISCKESRLRDPEAVLALQPLQHYSREDLLFIQQELESFYHRKVVVLPDRMLPEAFINREKGKRYSADQIIRWLADEKPDSITAVIGLTAEDIYTTKRDAEGKVKQPESRYAVWGIFGLGYRPGVACVVSGHRLQTGDAGKFRHRLRTVTLHEAGHNLGLPHCPSPGCIMSDANERIATIDGSGRDYCAGCRRRAGLQ